MSYGDLSDHVPVPGHHLSQVTPPDEPAVRRAMDQLAARVSELHDDLDRLAHRMAPVLGPVEAPGQADGALPQAVCSPLAQLIRDQADAIELAETKVRDLLVRLEV